MVPGADHQAGIEHVGKELLERVAAVGGQIGSHVLSAPVNLVAFAADLVEYSHAGLNVARRLGQQFSHSTNHFLPRRIALGTQRAPVCRDQSG